MTRLFLALFIFLSFTASAFAGPFDTCDYNVSTKDGIYEFVWKPTGAHMSAAVLVLPGRFKGFLPNSSKLTVRTVTMYQASTLKKIGTMTMKSNGICPSPPFKECLNRPAFYPASRLSGKALARRYGAIRLRVVTNVENHVHCTKAFNPQNRQD